MDLKSSKNLQLHLLKKEKRCQPKHALCFLDASMQGCKHRHERGVLMCHVLDSCGKEKCNAAHKLLLHSLPCVDYKRSPAHTYTRKSCFSSVTPHMSLLHPHCLIILSYSQHISCFAFS